MHGSRQEYMMKESDLSARRRQKSGTWLLAAVFFLTLLLMLVNQVFMNIAERQEEVYSRQVAEMRVMSQEIPKRATTAVAGNNRAFQLLEYSHDRFQEAWILLNNGQEAYLETSLGYQAPLAGQQELIETGFYQIPDLWFRMSVNIRKILADRQKLAAPAATFVDYFDPNVEVPAEYEPTLKSLAMDSEQLLTELTRLSEYFDQRELISLASPVTGFALLSLMLLTIILYSRQVIRESLETEQLTADKNRQINDAVQKLIYEISNLADGDLTVKATVGGDFTGTIAESINYTVKQLRLLVSAIRDVTVEVTTSTDSSRQMVSALSQAYSRQRESVDSVYDSIRAISNDINLVSVNARKCQEVAQDSVKTALGGAEVVNDTIQGMDCIRDQIQDTSKRIKRLGESSQEIGSFVSLINDIAEHTNTLSLNAAIQAAAAGEAGKGFAVVADEVHALAERSSEATRKIESLVRIIQGDIKEAVKSMEQTTAEVVSGTGLARSAGNALDDIQQVSRELAELVSSITNACDNQNQSASDLKRSMEVIKQVSAKTSNGIENTSEFMNLLGTLTERLEQAVAGFSLSKQSKWVKSRTRNVTSLELLKFNEAGTQEPARTRPDQYGAGNRESGPKIISA